MKTKSPKYRRQKSKTGDLGFVELEGRRHYLGKYESPESKQKYLRLVSEWMTGSHNLSSKDQITIIELAAGFWRHAQHYYRQSDGAPTSELDNFRIALKPLKELYGCLPAQEFGPLKLKTVRQRMVEKGWARTNINRMVGRVKLLFRWGTENELIRPDVLHALDSVPGLKRGRTEAPEPDPVLPVSSKEIEAVKPFVSSQVWALIQLQLHTAARGGELLKMRPIDLNMTDDVWSLKLDEHKTSYRGFERIIYIGPKGQEVIRPFLNGRPVNKYLFSPCEAVAGRRSKEKARRRPNQKKNVNKTNRTIGDFYTTTSYRKAIRRACLKAGIPVWTPHRLRHTTGTDIRRDHGLEAAQVFLGHARCDTTQVYAETNQQKAIEIAQKIG